METLFQKIAAQLPEIFHKEPPKKLPRQNPQKLNQRKRIILAALTTFTTLTASYLTYQYSFPKINLPDSPISNPIHTALKIVGPLAGLAGAVGLLAYNSSTEKETDLISQKNKKMQSIHNQNTKKNFDTLNHIKRRSSHSNVKKTFNGFNSKEIIDKNLLNELITKHKDLSTVSPEATVLKKTFISDITVLIQDYQASVFKYNTSLDEKKSNLIKIIDILDVFTGRTDILSCTLVKNLFPHIIPNGLHEMNQVFIEFEDTEYKKLVERSCLLTHKALTQQLKILFSDGINFETDAADKTISRILELLTPFKKDNFRLSPNFYANFIQHSPQLAWQFVQKYIFEHAFTTELLSDVDLSPSIMIANILKTREAKDNTNGDKSPRHKHEDGLDILKKIINGARCSLFLDDHNQGAASFAIRLMQHELKIDPAEFEKNYPHDNKYLKKLYFELCSQKELNFFKNFIEEKHLSSQGTQIANNLIIEHEKNFDKNHDLGSNNNKTRLSFLKKIAPLYKKNEYSKEEKKFIGKLSIYIQKLILNTNITSQTKLASLTLVRYPEILQNTESANLIRDAYHKVQQVLKDTVLNSACQKFLKNWDALNKSKSNIEDLNSEKETDLISQKSTKSQNTLNETPNAKRNFHKENFTHSDIQRLFKDFHAGEKIDKDLLEQLISTYINLSTTSPKTTISNETLISSIIKILNNYRKVFTDRNDNLDLKKSNLNKIIDILDVFTARIDPLSCQLINNIFYILSSDLHIMTQIIALQDEENKEFAERSCQLIYKASIQQIKILFKDGIDLGTKYEADQTFFRILKLLTPLDNDDFRKRPNFYTNFIQHSPKLAWRFIREYVLEYLINNEFSFNLHLLPENMIADFLNEKDIGHNHEDSLRFTNEDSFDILKKIVSDAQLSLFLEGDDEEAASFAIRLIQHKQNIKSEESEKNLNDIQLLQKLYLGLRTSTDPTYIKNFVKENDLTENGTKIANILISKYHTTAFVNQLLGSDITEIRQKFIELINSLVGKTEYSKSEMEFFKALSCFIVFQIHDPSILQRTELASLALSQYTEIFLYTKSAKIIKKAYEMVKPVENPHLDSACKQFIKTWDVQQKIQSEILEIDDLQSNIITLNSDLVDLRSNIIKLNSKNTKCLIS